MVEVGADHCPRRRRVPPRVRIDSHRRSAPITSGHSYATKDDEYAAADNDALTTPSDYNTYANRRDSAVARGRGGVRFGVRRGVANRARRNERQHPDDDVL